MKKRDIRFASIPSTEEVAAERERLAYQSRYQRVLRSTIYILVVVAAVAVLLATLFLPVLQVSGDSMYPTLNDKDIILLVKSNHIENGELCGFYWQNKLLLQREPQPAVVDGAVAVQDSPAAVGKKGRLIVEDLLLGQHQTAEHSGVKLKNDQSSGFPAVHQRAAKRHGFFASVHIGVHPRRLAAARAGALPRRRAEIHTYRRRRALLCLLAV